MNRSRSFVSLAFAIPLLAASMQVASAASSLGLRTTALSQDAAPTRPSAGSGPLPANPVGYQQVITGPFTDSAHAELVGDAVCPDGSRVVGGGALISSVGLQEYLAVSLPVNGRRWRVRVVNDGDIDGTFQVYAVCVRRSASYTNVAGPNVHNPAGTQTKATVSCPTGTVPFGGGGGGFISTLTVPKLNSSLPLATAWRVNVNNDSASDNDVGATAVCGIRPLHYSQQAGTATTVGPFSQASATVSCPTGTVVFGGGGLSSGRSPTVDMHSTAPTGASGWQVTENNNASRANTVTAYAVCGGRAS